MLLNVHIKNLALIDDANVDFGDNLNILTGETGAGKSIIIGALKIGMGGKLAKDLPREPEKEALCQLLFSIEDQQVWAQLEALDIPKSEENELIITRRIVNGRTINTINDESVTAAKLKSVSALLVDMHAQHEQQILLKKAEHQKILDKYGKHTIEPVKLKFQEAYRKYNEILTELKSIEMDESERARKTEFIQYEIAEIETAKLHIGEDEELEKLYHKMVHSRDIMESASLVYGITGYEDNRSAGNEIGRALVSLKSIKELDSELSDIYSQLETVDAMLNDFNMTLKEYTQSMEFDEAQFQETESRLNTINDIKGKYGKTIEDVFSCLEKMKDEYDKLTEYDEYIAKLKSECSLAYSALMKCAEALTKERKKQAKSLCSQVREALKELSFMEVSFDMIFDTFDSCTSSGMDDCYFVISTNIGEKPRPLYDVASGGELSRVMLAIKSCMAGEDNIDTLIFDEIDVGISGRAAQKVAEKLAVIARAHQVISITHLPQIAAMADNHYLIEKNAVNNKTVTNITKLDEEGQIAEIARLLGGASVTDTVINNAREMKDMAEQTKINHNEIIE